jgi:glycosidase
MQWDTSQNAGFSTANPWLPVSEDARVRNVNSQDEDANSLLNLYRSLIWYRRNSEALKTGRLKILTGPPDCLVCERQSGSQSVWIALNFGSERTKVPFSGEGVIVRSTEDSTRKEPVQGFVTLEAFEGVMVECGGN